MSRHIFLVSCLLLAFCSFSLAQNKFYDGIQIKNIRRTIDIKSHIETVTHNIDLINSGSQSAPSYFFSILPSKLQNFAYLEAVAGRQKLIAEQVSPSVVGAPEGSLTFNIQLRKELKVADIVTLKVTTSFVRTLQPYPAEITQSDSHLVLYKDNLYFWTPYTTLKQSTTVKLASSKVEHYTKKSASLRGSEIEYGPFEDIAPFTVQDLRIHYENTSPFATMLTAVKDIEISHYGNIAIEEHYELMNTGAKLQGSFSRFDFQRLGDVAPSAFRMVMARLPESATGIYYVDRIGNVSTSHVREAYNHLDMEIFTRFPMFGGWKTDFRIGYNVPAHEHLSHNGNTFLLNITFAASIPVAVDDMTVRIILPEGATDYKWTTPFDIDSDSFETRLTYLDTAGRPVIVLKKKNVVSHHSQNFQVAYEYSNSHHWQRVLLLCMVFFLFFVVNMITSRFEMSLLPVKKD